VTVSSSEGDLRDEALVAGAECAVHPDAPASFLCARCGTFGCAECAFSVIPRREVCRACAAKGLGEPIPWERRAELGTMLAFWQTVRLASFSPTAFFRTPTTQPSVLGAVMHGVATPTIGLLLSYVLIGLLMMLGGGVAALAIQDPEASMIGGVLAAYGCFFVGMSPVALIFGPANALLGAAFAAAASHGTLAVFKKTGASFEETLRASSYANAPRMFAFVPILGGLTYFWSVGLEVVALRETHRCGTGWALAAALGYRLVLFLMLIVAYAALIGAVFALERGHGA
jgi:hypothetical protein